MHIFELQLFEGCPAVLWSGFIIINDNDDDDNNMRLDPWKRSSETKLKGLINVKNNILIADKQVKALGSYAG